MNTGKIIISGLVGGVVIFLIGGLLYGLLLADFFTANIGTATGVEKASPNVPLLVVGNLLFGVVLAVIFGRWAGIKTPSTGATAGAVIGFLFFLANSLTLLAVWNVYTPVSAIADAVVAAVMFGAGGAVIGYMLGRGEKA